MRWFSYGDWTNDMLSCWESHKYTVQRSLCGTEKSWCIEVYAELGKYRVGAVVDHRRVSI
jgi:hypothetical protein